MNKEELVLTYLSFRDANAPPPHCFNSCSARWWERCLNSLDSAGMVFHFMAKLQERGDFKTLSSAIQSRLKKSLQDQTERHTRISEEFRQFNAILRAQGIRYICLKGLTTSPDFLDDPVKHLQSDHDFLVHQQDLQKAYNLFLELGFEPLDATHSIHSDHLPRLVQKSGWKWGGNIYDPDAPRAVELHFRVWNSQDRLPIRSLDEIWQRVIEMDIAGVAVPALARADALNFAILHAFRHLLENNLRLSYLHELAFNLYHHRHDEKFWISYREDLDRCHSTRKIAAMMLCLACHCFEPEIAPQILEFVTLNLSPAARLWIRNYGRKEAISSYHQSKSALFLHLEFFEDGGEIASTVLRRLFPCHLPFRDSLQFGDCENSPSHGESELVHIVLRFICRAFFHTVSLIGFLWRFPIWELRLICSRSQIRKHVGPST